MTVEFELAGQRMIALNGGPHFKVHGSDLALGGLQGPEGGGPLLNRLSRRPGIDVRLAQGQYGLPGRINPRFSGSC